MTPQQQFTAAIGSLPLIAILRGLQPDEAVDVGKALAASGWQLIEVPMNSPRPLQSIVLLATTFPKLLVGAGTVLTTQQVRDVHAAGGRLIVSPHFDPAVVREAVGLGLVCVPGVMTPSEAFAALGAGAAALKLFPAEMIAPLAVKALRAVLAPETLLLPVGGITLANMTAYRVAGANGFGLGSTLYAPGLPAAEVRRRALDFKSAWTGTMRA